MYGLIFILALPGFAVVQIGNTTSMVSASPQLSIVKRRKPQAHRRGPFHHTCPVSLVQQFPGRWLPL